MRDDQVISERAVGGETTPANHPVNTGSSNMFF